MLLFLTSQQIKTWLLLLLIKKTKARVGSRVASSPFLASAATVLHQDRSCKILKTLCCAIWRTHSPIVWCISISLAKNEIEDIWFPFSWKADMLVRLMASLTTLFFQGISIFTIKINLFFFEKMKILEKLELPNEP
jgi:hypothetical protein